MEYKQGTSSSVGMKLCSTSKVDYEFLVGGKYFQ